METKRRADEKRSAALEARLVVTGRRTHLESVVTLETECNADKRIVALESNLTRNVVPMQNVLPCWKATLETEHDALRSNQISLLELRIAARIANVNVRAKNNAVAPMQTAVVPMKLVATSIKLMVSLRMTTMNSLET